MDYEEIFGNFYQKKLQKTNETELRIEKVIKKRVMNFLLSEKVATTCLIVGLMKKIQYKMSYYTEPNSCVKNKIKRE